MSPNGSTTPCPILELRRYTLRTGQRDTLINLFEREFIEPQEAVGMQVLGQFRDLGRPDRFVWLRGFSDMVSREQGLRTFYGGPVWKAHRDAANATMLDSDDVFLLHPVEGTSGFTATFPPRPPVGAHAVPASVITATLFFVRPECAAGLAAFLRDEVQPHWRDAGAELLGHFETEHAPNTFPALPVRSGEQVHVLFARFADAAAHQAHRARLEESRTWREDVLPRLRCQLMHEPEEVRLSPASRSFVR